MSYPYGLSAAGSGRLRRDRRAWWITSMVLLALVVLVPVLVLRDSPDTAPTSAGGPASTTPASDGGLRWTDAQQPVPVSASHGPARRSGGLATGFSHDEMGAVLAALHIQSQLTAEAGPQIYERTAREQCFGAIDAAIELIRTSESSADPGSTAPSAYFYRVLGGDAFGDRVLVSVAAQTPQSTANGGFAATERAMEWRDGDWKMQLPAPRPQIIRSVGSYIPLGKPI